jgi:hypothetical protein
MKFTIINFPVLCTENPYLQRNSKPELLDSILKEQNTGGWMWWYIPVIPATWKADMGESQFESGHWQKCETLSEN